MAAALIRRVISPALLSSSSRPVRVVAQPAVSKRFLHMTNLIPPPDSDSDDDNDQPFPKLITRDTADGVYVFMQMPGVDKEDVKVRVEQNILVIKDEPKGESVDGMYDSRIDMSALVDSGCFKFDSIKAEMKNGVVHVFIPIIKEEVRSRGLDGHGPM